MKAVIWLLLASPAAAATLRVPQDHATIQEALSAAVACDVVEVGPGVWEERVFVPDGVTLRGAGSAQTVIDGGGRDEAGAWHPSVVELTNGATVVGFTLRNAGAGVVVRGNWHEARDLLIEEVDVGIAADHATIWVERVEIQRAVSKGVQARGGTIWLDDLAVVGAPVGVDVSGADGRILRADIEDCGQGMILAETSLSVRASATRGCEVGALLSRTSVAIEASTFSGNLVAVHALEGAPTLTDVSIQGGGWGGWFDYSDAVLAEVVIDAPSLGGLSIGLGAAVEIRSSRIAGAPTGVELIGGDALVHNLTVQDAAVGLVQVGGTLDLRSSLVVGCDVGLRATSGDRALGYVGWWGNTVDVSGGSTGASAIFEDPLLQPDGSLGAGSPAIDAGDPSAASQDPDGSPADLGWGGGPMAGATWTAPPPTPPQLGVQEIVQAWEGQYTTVFALGARDPWGDPLRIEWDLDPSDGLQYCDGVANGVSVYVPDDGTIALGIRLVDAEGFELTGETGILGLNEPPQLSWAAPDGVVEGAASPLFLDAWDPSELDVLAIDVDLGADGTWDLTDLEAGFVWWTPPDDGEQPLRVRLRDDDGGEALADVVVPVLNLPPRLDAPPPATSSTAGFEVTLQASDPSALDTVTATLIDGPPGMTVDGLQLRWVPAAAGAWDYRIELADEDGGATIVELALTVVEPPGDPATPGEGCACGGGGRGWALLGLMALRRRRQPIAARAM